jgi:ankyrin repeat protein
MTSLKSGTPLSIAAQYGHVEVVKVLLGLPTVEVNATNAQGFTALSRASDQVRVALCCQQARDDPSQAALVPIFYATPVVRLLWFDQGHHQIAQVLLAAGANAEARDSLGMSAPISS